MNLRNNFYCALPFWIVLALLAGCSATPQTREILANPPANYERRLEISDVPFFPQDEFQCGPAALATILVASGQEITPEELVPKVYLPARKGSLQVEMLAAGRDLDRLSVLIDPSLHSLFDWLNAGQPVLVLQNLGLDWYPAWHYAVVIGYDLDQKTILMRSGTIAEYKTKLSVFERTWRRSRFWGMVTLRPGELPLAQNPQLYFQAVAAFERRAARESSLSAWQTGTASWKHSIPILMGYGNHLYQDGDLQRAQAAYQNVIAIDPHYGPAINNLAQVYIDLEQPNDAVMLLERAIQLHDHNEQLYQKSLAQALARISKQ